MKKYSAIDHKDSKYYKDVPYITKKDFKKIENPNIIGKTRLKKYKSENDKDVSLLCFNNEEYEIKEKILGLKKGYVDVENNDYVILKKRIPFLFLFLLLCLFLLLTCFLKPNTEEKTPSKPIQEVVEPDKTPSVEEDDNNNIIENKPPSPSENKPIVTPIIEEDEPISYTIEFNLNGGTGEFGKIICEENKECLIPNKTPTKEGYSFQGWSEDKDGNAVYKEQSSINTLEQDSTEIILYAIWNINNYKISFIDFDNSLLEESQYNFGETIKAPTTPSRLGYTFSKWDTDFKNAKEDLIIKAMYDVNTYEISYQLNGGDIENIPTSYIVEDDIVIDNPKKIGYEFIGWSTPEDDTPIKDFKIEKGTTGDLELIAKYNPNLYHLIFDTNGANENISPREIKFDSEYGELPVVTKSGYTFVNWTNEEKVEVFSNTTFKEPNDIVIHANWKAINYNIRYNLVGGEVDNLPSSYTIESENILLTYPIKEGYEFIGWSTSEDNNTFIKDFEISKGSMGDIELTANYRPINYYISYNSNGAEGTMENTKVKYNNSANLRKNAFIKEGYIFTGWSIKPDGDILYKDEATIYNLSSKDNEIINLYANWEIIKLNVKYIDKFGAILKEETVDYGNKSIAPEDPFIDGYTFTGWSSNNEPIKSDTIFNAEYSINDYIIEYDLNIDDSQNKEIIHYNVESNDISLPSPTRTGYTFLGWTGSNGLNYEKNIIIPHGSIGNKSYKANWVANVYTVSLNPNNGVVNTDSIYVPYDSVYGIIPDASRHGYTFKGWFYDNNKIEESTVMKVASNHELIANWKTIDYSIDYNLNGGTANGLQTQYNIETETFTLIQPSKTGYTFVGWTGSNGNTPETNVTIPKGSTGNLNYTANYTYDTYSISYNLDGGNANGLRYNYTVDDSFTLPIPWRNGYDFVGWTGSNGSTAQESVSINRGTTGNKSYKANWRKYNANDYNGIYMVSTRNNVTWAYTLDGFYNVGDTNVHSGNWMVTVSDYCVDIVGTKYPDLPYTYQFYIYKANSTSELLATGNASVLGNYQNNARARICW